MCETFERNIMKKTARLSFLLALFILSSIHLYAAISWATITTNAAFGQREYHNMLCFDNRLWVMGGYDPYHGTYYNSVYYSYDGKNWTYAGALPFAGREKMGAVVFNGKMWVAGGMNDTGYPNYYVNTFNDVWSSSDGVNWTMTSANALGSGLHSFPMVSYNGEMWTIGGSNGSIGEPDVHHSADGVTWTLAPGGVLNRYGAGGAAFKNQLWAVAGYNGIAWVDNTVSSVDFSSSGATNFYDYRITDGYSRQYPAMANYDGKLWMIGGEYGDTYSSVTGTVWNFEGTQPWSTEADVHSEAPVFDDRMWISSPAYVTNFKYVYYSQKITLETALDNAGITCSTGSGSYADCFGQTRVSYYGGDAVKTGKVGPFGVSEFSTTLFPGNASFYWKVSSQASADYLNFYIDNVKQTGISGNQDWAQYSFTIPGGNGHVLSWRYEKDGSIDEGFDCGWVDKFTYVQFTPTVTPTITKTFSVSPTSTVTRTFTPTFTVTPTYTVTQTATVTNTPSITQTVTETATGTVTQTITETATATVTCTITGTATPTATASITRTITQTVTPTVTATITGTITPSVTRTVTRTVTPTQTCTSTRTATPTITMTATPSFTRTVTSTATDTPVSTWTVTPTETPTWTVSQTVTVTATYTATPVAKMMTGKNLINLSLDEKLVIYGNNLLPQGKSVELFVYNVLGKLVYYREYADNTEALEWDGKNNYGEKCGAGVYMIKIRAGNFRETLRVAVVK
jgi:hypothetical protein